jgi:hypothetical protein
MIPAPDHMMPAGRFVNVSTSPFDTILNVKFI